MRSNKGSVILSIIFMTLIIFLGLSLLNFTIIHNRVVKARNFHQSRSELLHNTLIRHLHTDLNKIKTSRFGSSIDDCSEYFNSNIYPDIKEDSINVKKTFSFTPRNFPMFKIIRGVFEIETMDPSKRHRWKSSSIFNIISGNIPINLIPVIINPPDLSEIEENIIFNNLRSTDSNHIIISDHESVFDISSYLADILKLDRNRLTIDSIMELFGNPENKNGIYFLESERDAGPVFVQGDAESISLSTDKNYQIIEIISGESYFRIRYSGEKYIYQSEKLSGHGNKIFNQKIIINGNVKILQAAGSPALVSNSHPELIVLGDISILSSITGINRNIHGLSDPGITIISAPSPFSGDNKLPTLTFRSNGPLNIHGSINIRGLVSNKNSDVTIKGNLYCRELSNSGNISIETISEYKPVSINNFYLSDISFIRDLRTEQIEEYFYSER
ncbi:MAG: hypothetical protein ABFR36_07315 [Acidobacteriota bacterium]